MRKDRIECSLILIDMSGFTQLLYQASHNEKIMDVVVKAMEKLFRKSSEAAAAIKDVQIINTTGDGFFAMATGKMPSRTAVAFARLVQRRFDTGVKSVLASLPFRQKVELRVAMHHGTIYKIQLDKKYGGIPLFISDDMNLLARVVGCQIARRYVFAITKTFHSRLMLASNKDYKFMPPDEVILDRNRYPEQIEIFRLPDSIPDYTPQADRHALGEAI